MRRFIDLAGGPEKARMFVIPNASGDGDTSCMDMAEEFHALGVRNVGCCFLNREQASDPNSAKLLDGATGVYFTGGDQVRGDQGARGNAHPPQSCWTSMRMAR